MTDPLTPEQQNRSACVYAASQSMLGDDPDADFLLAVAHYIHAGELPDSPINAGGVLSSIIDEPYRVSANTDAYRSKP